MNAATPGGPLALVLFFSTVLPIPIDTPIPCVICRATVAAASATFSGTVSKNTAAELRVYNFAERRSMAFEAPEGFHGVESGDGVVKDGTFERATPGLAARVTYTSAHGRNQAVKVELLTTEQCASLVASERSTGSKRECPD